MASLSGGEPKSSSPPLELRLLIDKYSVLRLDPVSTPFSSLTAIISSLASSSLTSPRSALFNLSITPSEISLVLPTLAIIDNGGRFRYGDLNPQAVESGWLAFRVEPPTDGASSPGNSDEKKSGFPPGIDFGVVGIMARISGLLARAEVSLFAISTFDTDYILVKEEKIATAVRALREDGCSVVLEDPESALWTELRLANNDGPV